MTDQTNLAEAKRNMRAAGREIIRFLHLTPVYLAATWHERQSTRLHAAAKKHDLATLEKVKRSREINELYPSLMLPGHLNGPRR